MYPAQTTSQYWIANDVAMLLKASDVPPILLTQWHPASDAAPLSILLLLLILATNHARLLILLPTIWPPDILFTITNPNKGAIYLAMELSALGSFHCNTACCLDVVP